jgi:hypothetical protein
VEAGDAVLALEVHNAKVGDALTMRVDVSYHNYMVVVGVERAFGIVDKAEPRI